MTDGVASRSFLCQKLPENSPILKKLLTQFIANIIVIFVNI